jgi:sec-independent protein translocase protein TatC
MATAIRPISHEDRLSLVDHLDELRTRLIISALALAIAFGLCLWQNHALLHLINKPYNAQTHKQVEEGHGVLGQATLAQKALIGLASQTEKLALTISAPGSGLSAPARKEVAELIPRLRAADAKVPRKSEGDKLTTLGIGEPFTATLTVTFVFALIFALPVILFELYGFLLPAFKPDERRVALPLLSAIPFLFVSGVLFGYFVVLPAAIHFFVNFNSSEFNTLVQANQYYKFAATMLLAMGLVFQVPVAILAATRVGIVTPRQLRKNRRYAVLACAAVAAFLPGDAITLLLETVPLYMLYEASIVIAALVARRSERRARAASTGQADSPASGQGAAATGGEPPDPGGQDLSVEQIIDHIDRDLSE